MSYIKYKLMAQACDCKRENFIFNIFVSSLWCRGAALNSATRHARESPPAEFSEKLGTECLNTRFSLPTLLCAE